MFWQQRANRRQVDDLWREPPLVTARGDGWIEHSGRRWIDFSSNDALGLGRDAVSVMAEAGAGSSRLVTGDLESLHDCESLLAQWCGFESALLVPSGWQANVSTLSGLFGPEDVVISDELNHASIVDGLRLSGCTKVITAHCNVDSVREALATHGDKVRGVVVESLYSVNGDFYPLQELLEVVAGFDLVVYIDEAHAAGLYGTNYEGRFSCETDANVIKVVTCSKALGCQGGVILCSQKLREWLINSCRGYIYSTGVSPIMASVIRNNVSRIRTEELGQEKLFELADHFHKKFTGGGFNVINDPGSHVIAIDFDGHESGWRHLKALTNEGVWPAFLRWPTVTKDHSRLRFSLSTSHTADQIDQTVSLLLNLS